MSTGTVVLVILAVLVLAGVYGLGVRHGYRLNDRLPPASPERETRPARRYPGRVERISSPGSGLGEIGGPGRDPRPEKDLTWRRTAVYIYSDRRGWRGGGLLYIGIAANPGKRARQHAGLETEPMKPWWPQVHAPATEAFWLPNRIAACCVEWALIHFLRPPWNIAPGGSDDAYCLDQPPIVPVSFEVPGATLGRLRRVAGQ